MFRKGVRTVLLAVVAFSLFYGFELWMHRHFRQWAYDTDQPILLGSWEGDFKDPDGIAKKIKIEVIEPEMKDWDVDHVRSHRRFDLADEFRGFATISSKLGVEKDRIVGELGADDDHVINNINFVALDEDKQIRESFNTSYTDGIGSWRDDEMKIRLVFVYRTKTGSGFSSSDDPRYKMKIPVTLHRVKN